MFFQMKIWYFTMVLPSVPLAQCHVARRVDHVLGDSQPGNIQCRQAEYIKTTPADRVQVGRPHLRQLPAQCHPVWVRHSTPETTLDTQRPQVPLR